MKKYVWLKIFEFDHYYIAGKFQLIACICIGEINRFLILYPAVSHKINPSNQNYMVTKIYMLKVSVERLTYD